MSERSPLVEVAAVLAALAAVPGIVLAVVGAKLMAGPEDMLMLINGVLGLGALGVGLAVTGFGIGTAVGLLRRAQSARIGAVALGLGAAVAGGILLPIGAWWPPLLLGGGIALVCLMFVPAVGRDVGPLVVGPSFPGRPEWRAGTPLPDDPFATPRPAEYREPWWELWRDAKLSNAEFVATTLAAVLLVLALVVVAAGGSPYAGLLFVASFPPLLWVEHRLRARRQLGRPPTATEIAGPNG